MRITPLFAAFLIPTVAFAQPAQPPNQSAAAISALDTLLHQAVEREANATAEVVGLRQQIADLNQQLMMLKSAKDQQATPPNPGAKTP